jgi:anthranilate/para-aminobenzoate synthase component I
VPTLARRLAERPGLVVLGSGFDAAGGGIAALSGGSSAVRRPAATFLACDPIGESSALDPEPQLPLGTGVSELARVPRWVGTLPYEAFRQLERPSLGRAVEDRAAPLIERVVWRRFGAVACVSDRVLVVGDDEAALKHLIQLLTRDPPLERTSGRGALGRVTALEPAAHHHERIRAALEHIAAGDLYQVNLARRFELEVHASTLELYGALSRAAPSAFAAAVDLGDAAYVSTSPELFLSVEPDGRLATVPIKGTRPRGPDAEADAALARELASDPKEAAELAMVLDVERNDLGRIARAGSVRLTKEPWVGHFGPVFHRQATLAARLRSGVTREELFRAMLPSGSVTGAPKIRAMELIARLEAERRGLYTGAYGVLRHDGSVCLAMAIRTLTRSGSQAHYFAGGGIVADSVPDTEVCETEWKAQQLTVLLAGDAAAPLKRAGA